MLTSKQKYLDGVSLCMDWQLGCNPQSMTYITGMGYRYPCRPQISGFLYKHDATYPGLRGKPLYAETVKGITMYGIGPQLSWYYPAWPTLRSYRQVYGGAECYNEFTISQCVGPTAMASAFLYAVEQGEKAVASR
jgi:hypothetical protein